MKQTPPALQDWLAEQGTIFAKEIGVVYDLEPYEVPSFLNSQLKPETCALHHVQNTFYLTAK